MRRTRFVLTMEAGFRDCPCGPLLFRSPSQKSLRLASVRNCSAELLPPNQVVWKCVLDSISANFRVTYLCR